VSDVFQAFSYTLKHRLNRGHRLAALKRLLCWQLHSRMVRSKITVPFLGDTRLLVRRGMKGATGNIYCGLHDFEDMAFVLHVLRPGELFVDIGANIGSYTLLAAGEAKARVVAVEPAPATFGDLLANISLNELQDLVQPYNIALGQKPGRVSFTAGLDTTNHVVAGNEAPVSSASVEVRTMDDLLAEAPSRFQVPGLAGPVLLKVDVEGFETEVIRGAGKTLQSSCLWGVLMELNGSGERYGYDEKALHRHMLDQGFSVAGYDPMTRTLQQEASRATDNLLYVRNRDFLTERCRTAAKRVINGVEF
jgi:FkbM family methyltransferase